MNQSNLTQSPMSTSPAVAPASSPQPSDDVMRLIADVESQMQRIRTAQKTQDDALSLLAQRTRSLEQAESEVARTRQQLASEQHNLQAQQEQLTRQLQKTETEQVSIAGQKSDLERTRAQFESKAADWQRQISQTEAALKSRESDIQHDRDKLAQIESQCRAQQQELATKTAEFESTSKELNRRVEQAERNVGELIARLETADAQTSQRQAQLDKAAAEHKASQKRVRDVEKLLHESTERADQAERDTAELAKLADQQRADVEARLAQITQELHKSQQSRDAALAETAAAREQIASAQVQLKRLEQQLEDRDAQLGDIQKKFELTARKLSEFATILSEQTPQVERGAAAMMMVEQQQQQIERLAKELAEYKLRVDPAEMQRRDQRIVELTEALRQARGQSAGGQGVGEVEQRNAELLSELNRLKVEVEKLTVSNDGAQRQLRKNADVASTEQGHEAMIAEHSARVAALNAEIERLQTSSAAELQTHLDQQARLHEQRLAERHEADVHEAETLRSRVEELERELQTARGASPKSVVGEKDQAEASRRLREKAERITAVAEHLRRRRGRLQKLRQLMIAKSIEGAPEQSPDQTLAMDEQKQRIAEARRALAEAEKEMVRRWARPRAVATMVWFCVLAVMCAIAGWLLADQLFPDRIAASVVLEARNTSRTPLTDDQSAQWASWHNGLFTDATFLQVAAKRLAERRLDRYASPQAIGQLLGNELTIDSSQKGAMILTLAGLDEVEITAVLDVVAATAAAESTRHFANRNDSAWATLPGERTEDGRARYATVNAVPISDERIKYAGIIFAVLFVVCMGCIAVIYTRLSRAKRVFDQDHSSLFADSRLTAA